MGQLGFSPEFQAVAMASANLQTKSSVEGLVHLLVLHLGWGSTFLVIRLALPA